MQPGNDDDDDDSMTSEQRAEIAKEREEMTKAADLERWQRKAVKRYTEGKPDKAQEFESEVIPPALAAAIRGALSETVDAADVPAVFRDALAWEGYP